LFKPSGFQVPLPSNPKDQGEENINENGVEQNAYHYQIFQQELASYYIHNGAPPRMAQVMMRLNEESFRISILRRVLSIQLVVSHLLCC